MTVGDIGRGEPGPRDAADDRCQLGPAQDDALRRPGRARRVDDARGVGGQRQRVQLDRGDVAGTRVVPLDRDHPLRRQIVGRPHQVGELGPDEREDRARVRERVGQVRPAQVGVDGHLQRAQTPQGQPTHRTVPGRREQGHDPIAAAHAEPAQPRRPAAHREPHLPVGLHRRGTVGRAHVRQEGPLRIGLGPVPDASGQGVVGVQRDSRRIIVRGRHLRPSRRRRNVPVQLRRHVRSSGRR